MCEGERLLWRRVLGQAYEDAEMDTVLVGLEGEINFEPEVCASARQFLRADSATDAACLEVICKLAEVPADRVVLWARKHYPAAA